MGPTTHLLFRAQLKRRAKPDGLRCAVCDAGVPKYKVQRLADGVTRPRTDEDNMVDFVGRLISI